MCPEVQVNRTRSRTPRTHANEEDGEDGVEHEDEEDDRHGGARLVKKEHDVNDA